MAVNGRAAFAVGTGILFVWSGIKGWAILGTAGDLLTGVKPSGATQPLTTSGGDASGGTSGIGTAGGSSVISIAEQYIGHAYHFGGAPGSDGSKPWDCSSFVNFVVGVRMGKAIPGYGPGKYKGTVHGPPTGAWAVWDGIQSVTRNNLAPGDIVVWGGHMGFALGPDRLLSALNPKAGTKEGAIDGAARGPIVRMGRLK